MVSEQTCVRCGVTKPASGNFKRSGQAKSGFERVCRACHIADHAAVTHLTCEGCHTTLPVAENFGRNPTTKTGYHYKCRKCMAAEREQWTAEVQRHRELDQLAGAFDKDNLSAIPFVNTRAANEVPTPWSAGRQLLYREAQYGVSVPSGQVIYTLDDPRTGAVRYIGRTRNPKRRFNSHLSERGWQPHLQDGILLLASPKSLWIRELRRSGLRPLMTIVEEVDPPELVYEREYRWMFHHLHQGADLTSTFTLSPALVAAIRATPLDYLHETLDSPAWASLAGIDEQQQMRFMEEQRVRSIPDFPSCCAASTPSPHSIAEWLRYEQRRRIQAPNPLDRIR